MGWNHQPEYTWLITSHVFFVVKLNFQMQKVVHRYVKILQILSQCSQSQQRAWQYQELRAETERLKAADVAATLLLSEKEEALSHGRSVWFKFQSGSILIEPFVWISRQGNLFEFFMLWERWLQGYGRAIQCGRSQLWILSRASVGRLCIS